MEDKDKDNEMNASFTMQERHIVKPNYAKQTEHAGLWTRELLIICAPSEINSATTGNSIPQGIGRPEASNTRAPS